jgi:hypothetical protein
MDGSGASFTDSGPNSLTVTAAGSATQSTTSGAFGGKALICGANTSDYIGISGNSVFSLSDFSISFRVSFPSGATGANILSLIDIGGYDTGISCRFAQATAGEIDYWYNPGSTYRQGPTNQPITNGQWYEVEICRSGSTIYMFWNGTLEDTATGMSWSFAATPALRIGNVLSGAANNNIARNFDDVLVTNTALHTSAYTPRTDSYTLT